MDYERLCDHYDRLEATTKRLEMTDILVELLAEAGPDVQEVVYLTRGQLAADFVGLELGIADKLIIRALAQVTGTSTGDITKLYHAKGDLGDAAQGVLSSGKGARRARQTTLFGEEEPAPIAKSVQDVFARLLELAQASGEGSQERRLNGLQVLLQNASPRAARYLVRTAMGKLRLGVADLTFLDALAIAYASKEDRPEIERAYNVSSDIGLVARVLRQHGLEGVGKIRLSVGVPVRAMLAERLPSLEEIMEKLGGEAQVELKYDGLRLQAHVPEMGPVQFFSRRLENVTAQFPDVAEALRAAFRGKETIVEGECVAIDPQTGDIRPFQDVAPRRGRKDVASIIEEVPVTLFLFDCILLDGEDVTGKPLPERRALLERSFVIRQGIEFSRAERVTTIEKMQSFFDESIAIGAEGIMVKSVKPASGYQPGSRGYHWIKYKRDYQAELTDSVDLVAVGALVGRGRRAGLYGALLMAAYNPDEDVFETVCKLGTGFDDAALQAAKEALAPTVREGGAHPRVRAKMAADVWFDPTKVAEVVGAELTLSPIHTAAWGALKPEAGLALRFPRFKRWRDDKKPEEATNLDELVTMFKQQGKRRLPTKEQ
ncbi:MAG: ATP-dependent DNA ligase [Candidatus Thermoplasmatota archaeon]